MPDVRYESLPDDLDHFVQGAYESHEIDLASAQGIVLFGDVAKIRGIVDGKIEGEPPRFDIFYRRLRARQLQAYGFSLIAQCDGPLVPAFYCLGLIGIAGKVKSVADWLCHYRYEDATIGGMMLPFKRHRLLTRDLYPTPRVRRRLYSRKSIKRYVRTVGIGEIDLIRQMLDTVCAEATKDARPFSWDADAGMETIHWIEEQLSEQYHRRSIPAERLASRLTRKKRSSLKKAVATAITILGASQVSAFARGDPIRLMGPEITFEVQKRVPITGGGHGALNIKIRNTDGNFLSGLCLYQDLPVLDQMISLSLYTMAGEQGKLLDAGNLYDIKPEARDYPSLAAKLQHADDIAPILPTVMRLENDRTRLEARQVEYAAEMIEVYRDEVAKIVFGRKRIDLFQALKTMAP